MTRRRSRRARPERPPLPPAVVGAETIEQRADGDWIVRRISGAAARKYYRCPGCQQEILPATPHVVCWRDDHIAERRHWHTACWTRRDRRTIPPGW
ncbi:MULTISPECIES: hypothetical protein [unclassified Frankia]|uniref:hypothetical protein n=1 Tax=unclassified Frankia TaxID=2632575 RepID=UPI002AD3E3CE|nr:MULTISPECIES: hypothetical protein [unclassified Frankia]